MAENKTVYDDWIEAFTIFNRYEIKGADIAADHDIVYAGPDPALVSQEDKDRLEELCWHESDEYPCFYRFC